MKQSDNTPICGIYCIENLINHKKYIGQSRDINRRFIVHKYNLKSNTHINSHLQSSWNIYGEQNFKFYIIEQCEKDYLDDKEKYYIQLYDSMANGYNLNAGGQGIPEYKHTPEEIAKMIQIQNPDPVYQCALQLNIIKEWPSASTAGKTLGFSIRHIKNCCNKKLKSKTVHRFIFVFKKDWDNLDRQYYLQNHRSYPIPILQIDNNGNIVKRWNSMYEIQATLHICCGEISTVCSGKRNTSNGFFWIKESEYNENNIELYKSKFIRPANGARKVYKYDLSQNLIDEYRSNAECMKCNNISRRIFEKYIDTDREYQGFYYTHKKILI